MYRFRKLDQTEIGLIRMTLVFMFTIGVLLTPIHEFNHYYAATIVGMGATIQGNETFINVSTCIGACPQWKMTFIALAGGLGSALVFSVLYFFLRRPDRYAMIPIIIGQIVYAPFDPPQTPLIFWMDFGMMISAWIVVVYLYTRKADQRLQWKFSLPRKLRIGR